MEAEVGWGYVVPSPTGSAWDALAQDVLWLAPGSARRLSGAAAEELFLTCQWKGAAQALANTPPLLLIY